MCLIISNWFIFSHLYYCHVDFTFFLLLPSLSSPLHLCRQTPSSSFRPITSDPNSISSHNHHSPPSPSPATITHLPSSTVIPTSLLHPHLHRSPSTFNHRRPPTRSYRDRRLLPCLAPFPLHSITFALSPSFSSLSFPFTANVPSPASNATTGDGRLTGLAGEHKNGGDGANGPWRWEAEVEAKKNVDEGRRERKKREKGYLPRVSRWLVNWLDWTHCTGGKYDPFKNVNITIFAIWLNFYSSPYDIIS